MLELMEQPMSEKSEFKNEERAELNETLKKLTLAVEDSVSFKQTFVRGILYGLGFVLSTTILAGVLYYIYVAIFGPDFLNLLLKVKIK